MWLVDRQDKAVDEIGPTDHGEGGWTIDEEAADIEPDTAQSDGQTAESGGHYALLNSSNGAARQPLPVEPHMLGECPRRERKVGTCIYQELMFMYPGTG